MGKKKSTKSTNLSSRRKLKKTTKIGIIVFIVLGVIGIILGVVFGVVIPNQEKNRAAAEAESNYWNTIKENKSATHVDIPEYVKNIPNYAFASNKSLESITFKGSIIIIGHAAFQKCSSLKSITIPKGVTAIGEFAFDRCESLESITIPDSVINIGKRAFSWCTSLRTLTIDNIDNITHIGEYAFSSSGLWKVIIRDKSGKEEIHKDCESFDPTIIDANIFKNSVSNFCKGGM